MSACPSRPARATPGGCWRRFAHEITVFKDVLRIDVQTRTPGVEFPAAWRDRVERTAGGVRYRIVSRDHLIAAKLAAGRPRDLEDVEVLRRSGLS